MELLRIAGLFAVTAVAEIVGCYLPWLVLKQGRSVWLLIPAAASLALMASGAILAQSLETADRQIGSAWMRSVQPDQFADAFLTPGNSTL